MIRNSKTFGGANARGTERHPFRKYLPDNKQAVAGDWMGKHKEGASSKNEDQAGERKKLLKSKKGEAIRRTTAKRVESQMGKGQNHHETRRGGWL